MALYPARPPAYITPMVTCLIRAALAAALILPLCFAPDSVRAQDEGREITLSAKQKTLVRRVETYLNGITTLQSTFFQQASTNEFAEGQIFLSRPGKMRIEYKAPNPILIVATGEFLSYIDKELKNVTHIPVDDTPAAFLLNGNIRFDPKRVAFYEAAEEDGAVFLTVGERADPFAGRLTLIFRTNPMSLRKWSVVDAQGTITDIVLTDPFYGGQIDPKLFTVPEFEQTRSGD
ncbi:MAG TPA: outer membrane lipoprotein carrier protein LolA [Rhodospirillaceae bacterium]|nr:outer membrane lipoprotein carrier protein LolA [Rhodospirillaceae bacterium]